MRFNQILKQKVLFVTLSKIVFHKNLWTNLKSDQTLLATSGGEDGSDPSDLDLLNNPEEPYRTRSQSITFESGAEFFLRVSR